METKERNLREEKATGNEEVLNKKEVISDEDLLEVAGGNRGDTFTSYPACIDYCSQFSNDSKRAQCMEEHCPIH